MEPTAPPDETPHIPEAVTTQQRIDSIIEKTILLTQDREITHFPQGSFKNRPERLEDGSTIDLFYFLRTSDEEFGSKKIQLDYSIEDESGGMTIRHYIATRDHTYDPHFELKKYESYYSKKEVDYQKKLVGKAKTSKVARVKLLKRVQENTRREQIERRQQEESGKSVVSDKEAEKIENILNGLLQKDEPSV